MVLYSNPFRSSKIDRQSLPESVLPRENALWYIAAREIGTTPPVLADSEDFPTDRPMTTPDSAAPASRWSASALCALVLMVPAVVSLFHSVAASRTLAAVSGTDRPALAFDQYMVNFGEAQPRPIHEAQFYFRNRSSHPVKITAVNPSCGCLTPRIVGFNAQRRHEERTEFAPGEYGVLAMGIRPAKEQPGDKAYNVVVDYDDGQKRSETLEFRITLPKKKLTVEPNELYFYQTTGEPDSRVIMVRDFRDKPAEVVSVEVLTAGRKGQGEAFSGVNATLGQATAGADGERTIPIEVSVAPDQPTGRRNGWIVITTNDPDSPKVKIPLLVIGKEQATAGGAEPGKSSAETYGPAQQAAAPNESKTE